MVSPSFLLQQVITFCDPKCREVNGDDDVDEVASRYSFATAVRVSPPRPLATCDLRPAVTLLAPTEQIGR